MRTLYQIWTGMKEQRHRPCNFPARPVALYKWCDVQMLVWWDVHRYITPYRQQQSSSPYTHAIQSSRLQAARHQKRLRPPAVLTEQPLRGIPVQ